MGTLLSLHFRLVWRHLTHFAFFCSTAAFSVCGGGGGLVGFKEGRHDTAALHFCACVGGGGDMATAAGVAGSDSKEERRRKRRKAHHLPHIPPRCACLLPISDPKDRQTWHGRRQAGKQEAGRQAGAKDSLAVKSVHVSLPPRSTAFPACLCLSATVLCHPPNLSSLSSICWTCPLPQL